MVYNNIEDITKMIKHIMIDNNIKQKDIVEKSNWTKQTVSNLLNNRTKNIGIDTLKELCDALGYNLCIEIKKSNNNEN